jgi:hypothetical protein
MQNELKIYDVVVLTKDIPAEKLNKGTMGTIIEVFNDDAFMVEFSYKTGVAFADPVLKKNQLMKVYFEPIHA